MWSRARSAVEDTDRRLHLELFHVTSFVCCNCHETSNVIDALTKKHQQYFAIITCPVAVCRLTLLLFARKIPSTRFRSWPPARVKQCTDSSGDEDARDSSKSQKPAIILAKGLFAAGSAQSTANAGSQVTRQPSKPRTRVVFILCRTVALPITRAAGYV